MVDFRSQLSEVLAADAGILEAFGMDVTEVPEGCCRFTCTVPDGLVNARGFGHGSIAFALMDTAAAYALRSVNAGGVTTNANVIYVRGVAAHDELHGEVQVVSAGRRVASVRGEVYRADKLIAHGTFTFQVLDGMD